MKESARALLDGIVDYAGTFPPARLSVPAAVRLYAGYRTGSRAWVLGRLILPISDLGTGRSLEREAAKTPGSPWILSAIVPVTEVPAFRPTLMEHVREDVFRIDSVEVPPCEPEQIRAVRLIEEGREVFFEVPLGPGMERRLDAIAAAGCGAKVRTGGLEPRAFPSPEQLAGFLVVCRERRISFKATAGLHHPFRSTRKLGEEAGGAEVLMHGFVNLAVAACLLDAGVIGAREIVEVLEEREPGAFVFEERGIEWRGRRVGVPEIVHARRSFFRSFGACSFEEPVEGLVEAGVI